MENELIKIATNEKQESLVSARELHEFLEVKSKYSDWIKNRISKYNFEENLDYTLVAKILETNNPKNPTTEIKEHIITLDMAKELSMVENNDKGRKARKYFIQCEKKLKEISNSTKALPQDYLSALKALVTSEEEKALMVPKVEYYENTLRPDTYKKFINMTAIAKDLGMSAQKLNKTLNELKVIYKGKDKTWYLYKDHEDKIPEYCDYIINEYGQSLKFTELGREWIIKLLEENK